MALEVPGRRVSVSNLIHQGDKGFLRLGESLDEIGIRVSDLPAGPWDRMQEMETPKKNRHRLLRRSSGGGAPAPDDRARSTAGG